MFDSPSSHSQIFAGFGRQSSTDSFGTMRKYQAGTRLSNMANAKRTYDEVKVFFVKKLFCFENKFFFRH
jgi:hypothetical protein